MNKITCICLGVRNMEESIKFYRDRLGFQTDAITPKLYSLIHPAQNLSSIPWTY